MIKLQKLYNTIYDESTMRVVECFNVSPNTYMVNPYGRIFEISTGKEVNQYINIHGYTTISLKTNINTYKQYRVHRIVASMYCIKPILSYDVVNHKDANKLNNYYQNLEWCTSRQNTMHAHSLGLFQTVLNIDQVHIICRELVKGTPYKDICTIIGFDSDAKNILDIITKIRTKKLWVEISDQYPIPASDKQRRPQNEYTFDEIHQICQCIIAGLTNIQVANALNIDITDKKDYERWLKFIERIRRGETFAHISSMYKMPIPKPKRQLKASRTDEEIHMICKYIQDGLSVKEIADKMGVELGKRGTPEYNSWYNLIGNIRGRRKYTHISKGYVW